jgi:hypothetical protein
VGGASGGTGPDGAGGSGGVSATGGSGGTGGEAGSGTAGTTASGGTGNTCSSGLVCNGTCVRLDDSQNCGACGRVCPNAQYCSRAQCVCLSGITRCGDACVSLNSDEQNCGLCGKACRSGEDCSAGSCKCPSTGSSWCTSAGTCVDTLSNNQHCGQCDRVCPAQTTCSGGQCRCDELGNTLCDSTCVNLSSDVSNCGQCARACRLKQICSAGSCICPTPIVATPVRITNTSAESGRISAAWDGTHVGMAYFEGNNDLVFTLLNPDGTRASASDTVIEYAVDDGLRPRVIYNGREYAVVWADGFYTTFARVSTSATVLGSPVTVGGGGWVPGVAWSSVYGGYAVSTGQSNQVSFRRLGATASALEPPISLEVGFGDATALATAPDGTWQLLANSVLSTQQGVRIASFNMRSIRKRWPLVDGRRGREDASGVSPNAPC